MGPTFTLTTRSTTWRSSMFKEVKELLSEADWRGILALVLSVSAIGAVLTHNSQADLLIGLAGVAVGFWFGKK